MSISNETIDGLLFTLHNIAVVADPNEYALPIEIELYVEQMREAVREVLECPATQCCPQCEAKEREISELKGQLTTAGEFDGLIGLLDEESVLEQKADGWHWYPSRAEMDDETNTIGNPDLCALLRDLFPPEYDHEDEVNHE